MVGVSTPQAGSGLFSPLELNLTVSADKGFQPLKREAASLAPVGSSRPSGTTLQLHLEKEEFSRESSWEISREPESLRALLASMCHARSCNPSDWYPSSKARTA